MRLTGNDHSKASEATWQQGSDLIGRVISYYFGSGWDARLEHFDFSASEYDAAASENWVVSALRDAGGTISYENVARLVSEHGKSEASIACNDKSSLESLRTQGSPADTIIASWRLEMCLYEMSDIGGEGMWEVSTKDISVLIDMYCMYAGVQSFEELNEWGSGRNYISDGSCLYWAIKRYMDESNVAGATTAAAFAANMRIPGHSLGNYSASEVRIDLLREATTTRDATRLSDIMLECGGPVDGEDNESQHTGCVAWLGRMPMRLDPYIIAEWRLRTCLGLD